MKRSLYILGGILIVVLLAIWLFLLFADDSTKADVYNRFGLTGTPEEGVFEEVIDAIVPDVFKKQYLRQLTTKRVVGYTEVTAGSSTVVYFVEGGTGHLYSIDPSIEDSEVRLSNITIPVTTKAEISKDGTVVVAQSHNKADGPLTILTRTGDTFESQSLDEAVRSFAVSAKNTILFTTFGGSGLLGKEYDVTTKTTSTLFEVPFREATVVWGEEASSPHYVFPKTSRYLEGYLYVTEAGKLTRLPASGFGFMAQGNAEHVLFSKLTAGSFTSHLLSLSDRSTNRIGVALVPEKCTLDTKWMYCAVQNIAADERFPDNWYRGEVSFSDELWKFSLASLETDILVDTRTESGREIDAIDLQSQAPYLFLYFLNKKDQSLWVYESKKPTGPNQ